MSSHLKNENSNKNIELAEHAGFCYGVKRAVETTKKLKLENPDKEVCVLGELIHNSLVINELERLNIKKIDSVEECPTTGGICVIRSHGVPNCICEQLKEKNIEIADLTCPDVKKVQKKAIELAKDGYNVVIIGKSEHPEVIAIKANAQQFGNYVWVVSSVEDFDAIGEELFSSKKIGVVVQTTQRVSVLKEIVDYLLPKVSELKVFNTICASTSLRQKEARELAQKSDMMIVVGSKKSANTSHLAEILTPITSTIHIESAEELEQYSSLINKAKNIGVTAGASTPDYLIQEVLKSLKAY